MRFRLGFRTQRIDAQLNHGHRVFWHLIGVDIAGEIAQGNDLVFVRCQVMQVGFEPVDPTADPIVRSIGNAMELQNGDLPILRLLDGVNQILQLPVGSCIAGGGQQKRMILTSLIRDASPVFIGILRLTTTPGKQILNYQGVEYC